MVSNAPLKPNPKVEAPDKFTLLVVFIAACVIPHIPLLAFLTYPVEAVTTLVHELSHALAAVLTGGSVAAMTIVPDGAGHGGLTFSTGGNRFIISQAGYLGTTLMGCALIALARFPSMAKGALIALGVAFGLASVTFMFKSVFFMESLAGLTSIVLGLCLAAAFVRVGWVLSPRWANLLLLFVGVQMGMNAIDDVYFLTRMTMGLGGVITSSDAGNMQQLTGVPAWLWAILWTGMSLGFVYLTIMWTYKSDKKA
jgi:hypothetical protein